MKFKTLLSMVIMAMLLIVISACGNGKTEEGSGDEGNAGSDEVKTIKIANYFAEDHPTNVALREKFKPVIEEQTGGKYVVEIFPNNELGDEEQFTNGVRNGTIEMSVSGMALQSANPKIGALEWPFLFEDYNVAQKLLNGEVGDYVEPAFRELGAEPLAWTANGFRVVSSNKPIKSMEDFEGFQLRMPNIPIFLRTGEALGATIQPLAFSEVFTALEQGVIDGQDNPYATLYASKWYEVQDYVTETRHMFSPNIILINKKLFEGLDAETQKIFQEAATETANYQWELAIKAEDEVKGLLAEEGVEVIIPDEQFRQNLKAAMDPVYEGLKKDFDWAEEYLKLVEETKAK